MHPTEDPPSDVHEPDTDEDAQSSPEATEQEASPSWWRRLTSRVLREEVPPEPEETEATPAVAPQRTLEQVDIDRLIQSEADRREAARNRAARDAERRRLRDEDPFEYVEQEKQAEAQQAQSAQLDELFQGIGRAHDEVTLVPLMQALEPDEYQRIMGLPGAGVGGDGRKLLITETLESLKKRYKAEGAKEAEAKLRRNQAFRKQVLSEFNGGASSPEPVPSGSTARGGRLGSQEINDILRQRVNLPTS